MRSTLQLITLAILSLLLATACGESEQEQQQQAEYEAELLQQMIQTTPEFNQQLEGLLEEYFDLKNALVDSDAERASGEATELAERARSIDSGNLDSETAMVWSAFADVIISESDEIPALGDVDDQRIHFEEISETMIQIVETFRPLGYEVYVQSCPMVRDGSADWLSREEEIRNPYHGDRMMNCGEVLRRL